MSRLSRNEPVPEMLSPRELTVVKMIVDGKPYKQVGSDLGISLKTVEFHMTNARTKLKVFSLPGLTKWALRAGITSLW